jgi:predicted membrane-bound dolichyl-phosphate-mannose-protein mannosyltransferase
LGIALFLLGMLSLFFMSRALNNFFDQYWRLVAVIAMKLSFLVFFTCVIVSVFGKKWLHFVVRLMKTETTSRPPLLIKSAHAAQKFASASFFRFQGLKPSLVASFIQQKCWSILKGTPGTVLVKH